MKRITCPYCSERGEYGRGDGDNVTYGATNGALVEACDTGEPDPQYCGLYRIAVNINALTLTKIIPSHNFIAALKTVSCSGGQVSDFQTGDILVSLDLGGPGGTIRIQVITSDQNPALDWTNTSINPANGIDIYLDNTGYYLIVKYRQTGAGSWTSALAVAFTARAVAAATVRSTPAFSSLPRTAVAILAPALPTLHPNLK